MRSKKLTKLSAILLGASLTCGVLGIATACGEEPAPAHDHTYATEWTKTEYEHYYAATCEHSTEKKDVGGHRLVDGACSVCGYTKDAVASYAYEEVEGGIAITAYTGDPMDEITLPATIDGKKVVAIANDTFNILNEEPEATLDSLKQVKTIKIEAEIQTIGKRNFTRMASLKSVVLPDSVTKVDTGCFYSNPQLTTVKVPSGYVVLGTETLQSCPKLKSIQLPEALSLADASVFKGLANDFDITYAGSKGEWNASTYKAVNRLKNAAVKYYNGSKVATEEDGGYVYRLNADNNSYSIVGLTADIISETSTVINLPLTYKEKNVTALGGAVFNINAYDAEEDAALIAYLKTVTAVDVNSAFKAKDTHITSIGNHNFVGMSALNRTTLPAEITNETLVGCWINVPLRGQVRIPKGVKVLQDSYLWTSEKVNVMFMATLGGAFEVTLNLPLSFEKFENCFEMTPGGLHNIMVLFEGPDKEYKMNEDGSFATEDDGVTPIVLSAPAVDKYNKIIDDSTFPIGGFGDWMKTLAGAQVIGQGNPYWAQGVALTQAGILSAPEENPWHVYNSYEDVVDAGY